MSEEPEAKGGHDKAEWMRRFAAQFEALGWTPYAAECEALAAWECAWDDADPEEAAAAEISYLSEG